MSEDRKRKLLWWNMPIGPDDKAEAGKYMMRVIAIWAAVIVLVVVIGIIVFN